MKTDEVISLQLNTDTWCLTCKDSGNGFIGTFQSKIPINVGDKFTRLPFGNLNGKIFAVSEIIECRPAKVKTGYPHKLDFYKVFLLEDYIK